MEAVLGLIVCEAPAALSRKGVQASATRSIIRRSEVTFVPCTHTHTAVGRDCVRLVFGSPNRINAKEVSREKQD